VKAPPGKTRITIRLDDDILDWLRQQAHHQGGARPLIDRAAHSAIAHVTIVCVPVGTVRLSGYTVTARAVLVSGQRAVSTAIA
jgi:hypothetical protein